MAIIAFILFVSSAQAPGESPPPVSAAEAPATEPPAEGVEPNAEPAAAGMPTPAAVPTRATAPALAPEPPPGRHINVYRDHGGIDDRDPIPRGQIRPPAPPHIYFRGVTPYIDGETASLVAVYAEMGRYDLVEDYHAGKRLKNGMMLGGAIGFGAAAAGAFAGYFLWLEDLVRMDFTVVDGTQSMFTRGVGVMLASVGVGIVSVVIAVVGYFMDPQPLSPGQARAVFEQWAATEESEPVGMKISPVVTDGGGGLALSAVF